MEGGREGGVATTLVEEEETSRVQLKRGHKSEATAQEGEKGEYFWGFILETNQWLMYSWGPSWSGSSILSLAAHWLGAARRNVSQPAYGKRSRGNDLQAPSQRHKVAIVLEFEGKGGTESECGKKPITFFPLSLLSLSLLCLFLSPSLVFPCPVSFEMLKSSFHLLFASHAVCVFLGFVVCFQVSDRDGQK